MVVEIDGSLPNREGAARCTESMMMVSNDSSFRSKIEMYAYIRPIIACPCRLPAHALVYC